jgi:hypothetical protein
MLRFKKILTYLNPDRNWGIITKSDIITINDNDLSPGFDKFLKEISYNTGYDYIIMI